MRTVFLAFILTLVFGGIASANTQNGRTVKVQVNQQKNVARTGLSVRFVSLIEDSRCPIDTNCVWAGNAKIQVKVSNNRGSETFEINTGTGARGASFGGYAINLTNLTPAPRSNVRINRNGYVATFEIVKLTR